MPHNTLWISLWTTLALWLGSIGGCVMSENPSPTTAPDVSQTPATHSLAAADGVDLSPKTTPATTASLAPQPVTITDESPSLRGLDRSHWSKVTVGPADGRTTHNPVYFHDCPLDAPVPNLADLPDTQAQLEAALNGPWANNYNSTNTAGMATQPLKASFDTLLAPVHMIFNPPLKLVTTPGNPATP